jgi:hypothetical protein
MGEAELDAEAGDRSSYTDKEDTGNETADSTITRACPSAVDRITGPIRAVAGFLHRRALIRATRAIPRTFLFVGSAMLRGEVADSLPAPHLSVGLAAQVAMDEALLAVAMTPRRLPLPGDYVRVAAELAERRRPVHPEWLDRGPSLVPSNTATPFRWRRQQSQGLGDGPRLRPVELGQRFRAPSGRARQRSVDGIRTQPDRLGRRPPSRRRPPAVGDRRTRVLHGISVHGLPGPPGIARIHRELGMNVVLPALPLHGPRRVTLVSGEPFLSFELMNAVHGLTQAVWDIRRLLHWVRDQGATSISLYGVSLGAYVVSLLAGIEEGVDAVVAGIPVSDFPGLFHHHSPRDIRARSIEHKIMGGAAENVYRVVSPLRFEAEDPNESPLHLCRLRRSAGPSRPGAAPLGALGQTSHLVVCGQPRRLPLVQAGVRFPG